MELKSTDNDYYAIYKEYKQKYLDLKNSVLEGGGVKSQAENYYDIFIKNNIKESMDFYNSYIESTIFNESMKTLIKLHNEMPEELIITKTFIKENKIFEIFKQIDNIQNSLDLLNKSDRRSDLLQNVLESINKNISNIDKLRSGKVIFNTSNITAMEDFVEEYKKYKQNNQKKIPVEKLNELKEHIKNILLKPNTNAKKEEPVAQLAEQETEEPVAQLAEQEIETIQTQKAAEQLRIANVKAAAEEKDAQAAVQKAKQQQQEQEQEQEQDYSDYARNRQDVDSKIDSDNSIEIESLSSITTPSSTHNFDQKNYLIKVGDKFLIFDIKDIDKIENLLNSNNVLNADVNADVNVDVNKVYKNFSKFHQLNIDDEVKTGNKIILKTDFKQMVTEKKILNAYIITITNIKDNDKFEIEMHDIQNKLNKLEEYIGKIVQQIDILKPCNIDSQFDKLVENNSLNEFVESVNTKKANLNSGFTLEVGKVKELLIEELNLIKDKNKITEKHIIKGELNTNFSDSDNVKVGNKKLLELIKGLVSTSTSTSKSK